MSYSTSASTYGRHALPASPQNGVKNFVLETYVIFSVSLLVMTALGLGAYHFAPKEWLGPLAIADGVMWVLCGWFGWRRPMALVFPLFTIITGLLMGLLAHFYAEVFAVATFWTIFTFLGLSAFVWISGWDFSFLAGFLCVAFFVLLGGAILSFFLPDMHFLLLLTGFGVFTFGCWILYDTSQILNRVDADYDSVIAAFELILDIVGFHRWLLEHLSIWDLLDA